MPRLSAALQRAAADALAAPAAEKAPTAAAEPPTPRRLEVPPPPTHALLARARLYRQPDGRLSPTKPPPDPYTVAARREWADLVRYTRVNGGCREATETGVSFRYGIGVSYAEHAAYLQSLGLQPEAGQDGVWPGYDPAKTNPLDDPGHPLHGWRDNPLFAPRARADGASDNPLFEDS